MSQTAEQIEAAIDAEMARAVHGEYLVEEMDANGRWHIVGHDLVSGWAQHWMNQRQRTFPDLPMRVVEARTRQIVLLHDPRAVA